VIEPRVDTLSGRSLLLAATPAHALKADRRGAGALVETTVTEPRLLPRLHMRQYLNHFDVHERN
jgi:hypothetical protein